MALLIGFDDTPTGHDAVAFGLQVAAKEGEALTVACAFPGDDQGPLVAIQEHEWIDQIRGVALGKLDAARRLIGDRPDVEYQAIGPGTASRTLHGLAEQIEPRLLVVGSSEHAAHGRISLGSTVANLLQGSPCPVAVAPKAYRSKPGVIRSIAVAYDGSPAADDAVHFATDAARRRDASLKLIAVVPRDSDEMQATISRALAALPSDISAEGSVLVARNAVRTLSDLPGEKPDVLVCGSRGYGVARQVLLGSVSSQLVRNAAYPVVVVPRQS